MNLCCDDKISDHSTGKWMSRHTHEFCERVYMIQLKGASNVNDGCTDGEIININRMCSREMLPHKIEEINLRALKIRFSLLVQKASIELQFLTDH